ncbi:MarR family winged helix-turn-helix transcriptional regulator [Aeromicrobium sp.]|uniref:MarR family winged helix-turn-helix transcriptional regulator n=1 Tax=Aeromicrobium sp. TaxID=1871063 RepID=UPI002FCB7CD2
MATNTQLEEALQQFLLRCMSSAEAQGIDRLVELELSISQAKTVFVLAQAAGPLPIHAIAEQIRLSVAATGRNIDQLVKMGLLERKEDENDRRVKLVTLTKAGHDVADQHLEARRTALRAMVSRLSADEAHRLQDALQPILAGDVLRPETQETPE